MRKNVQVRGVPTKVVRGASRERTKTGLGKGIKLVAELIKAREVTKSAKARKTVEWMAQKWPAMVKPKAVNRKAQSSNQCRNLQTERGPKAPFD